MRQFARILCAAALCAALAGPAAAQVATWESPAITDQLAMDNTIVPVGKGAVFCPVMTDGENEPSYGVLEDGEITVSGRMGHRITLAPGVYEIVYGSGSLGQLMRKRVRVEEGATTVIKSDWAGLVIEVINETRANIREYYELFHMESGDSYGVGQGVEEGLDERIRTWILQPGLYKIVKPGDNVNAVVNFGTIRLLPGELNRVSLVLESQTGDFLGFGHIADVRQQARQRTLNWRLRSELSGNALLNYVPTSESGGEEDASFTATGQWLSDGRYQNGRHIIPIWSNLEEGLSMTSDREIHKHIDKAEIKLTYIYRLSNMLSPYIRASGETRLFETKHYFDDPLDYAVLDDVGDTLRVVNDAEEVVIGKAFSPIQFKQGFGLTSSLIQSVPVNINLRSGYGARQTFSRSAKIFNNDNNTLFPVVESDLTGVEFLFLGDFRLGRYIILNTEFDVLMPKEDQQSWIYDSESRLRLNLTSNVSLLFTAEFWKDESVAHTQRRFQTLLRFSKYL